MRRHLLAVAVLLAVFLAINECHERMQTFVHRLSVVKKEDRRKTAVKNWSLPKPRPAISQEGASVMSSPREIAEEYLVQHRDSLRLQPHHELRPEVYETPIGSTVRYGVFQDGLPIVGIGIEIQLDRDLAITRVNNEYRPLKKADLSEPMLTQEDVLEKVSSRFVTDSDRVAQSSSLLYVEPGSDQPSLAYSVPVREMGKRSRSMQVLVRASDGQILRKSFSRAD